MCGPDKALSRAHLVQGPAAVHQDAHRLRVLQALLQFLQLQICRPEVVVLPQEGEGQKLAFALVGGVWRRDPERQPNPGAPALVLT